MVQNRRVGVVLAVRVLIEIVGVTLALDIRVDRGGKLGVNEVLKREVPEPLGILDTLVLSRRVGLPRPHKLGSLCERFGIALERAHTADADAGAALLLLWKIMQGLAKKSDRSLEGLLNLMGNRA